jgi:hypothetical protein
MIAVRVRYIRGQLETAGLTPQPDHVCHGLHRRSRASSRREASLSSAIDGPIRATVEPLIETSSRLTIAVDFDEHGIGKLLVPLIVGRQAQKEMPANVEALKRRVEAQQP